MIHLIVWPPWPALISHLRRELAIVGVQQLAIVEPQQPAIAGAELPSGSVLLITQDSVVSVLWAALSS